MLKMVNSPNIAVIVNDAGDMSLNGKTVLFEGGHKSVGRQLISISAPDIGQAIQKAVVKAAKIGEGYPYVQLDIEKPSPRHADPTDPYLYIWSPDKKSYLFNASFFLDGILAD